MVERSLPALPPLDGPAKASGRAKYTYDLKPKGMLWAKALRCPHAHARIESLDVSAAEGMPGVKAVRIVQGTGAEIQWAGDDVVLLAATSEAAAEDAVAAIKVEYEVLPHWVADDKLEGAPDVKDEPGWAEGDPVAALAAAPVKIKGLYGIPLVAYNRLEPHGQLCEWTGGDALTVRCPTQPVAGLAPQLAEGLGIPAANVHVVVEEMGGDFGNTYSADRWVLDCARLAKQAGAPVKLMLERDIELTVAGDRPSVYAEIEAGAERDGTLTGWISKSWGAGGLVGAGGPPLPYVFQIPNRRQRHVSILTNTASSRALRVPNHPQACYLTLSALDDLAAALGMNPLDFFLQNLALTGQVERIYREELPIADQLMGWRQLWHPRGDAAGGPVKRGLGLSLHTWGNCEVLADNGVGGVQMADVSVDVETGVVKVNKLVAVQDCGLIGDLKRAESRVHGGLVMGVSHALSEEKVVDPVTGTTLNVGFESYKMAGIADVGELVVHMMTGPGYDERGVIGLGEPPVVSPGAAIANAVANAIGVRVPYLPLTPRRVLDALEGKKGAA